MARFVRCATGPVALAPFLTALHSLKMFVKTLGFWLGLVYGLVQHFYAAAAVVASYRCA